MRWPGKAGKKLTKAKFQGNIRKIDQSQVRIPRWDCQFISCISWWAESLARKRRTQINNFGGHKITSHNFFGLKNASHSYKSLFVLWLVTESIILTHWMHHRVAIGKMNSYIWWNTSHFLFIFLQGATTQLWFSGNSVEFSNAMKAFWMSAYMWAVLGVGPCGISRFGASTSERNRAEMFSFKWSRPQYKIDIIWPFDNLKYDSG